ncbi:Holliday junction resolvase RuvX [Alienimonas chondri]|nr:Holliday junction resolvase RuvX [Alienimonas chondri]
MFYEGDSPEYPKYGRVLGLDHGKVRIGVAASDTGQEYAAAVETYVRTDPGADAAFFKTLKREYDPVAVVVGLPLHFGGEESGSSGGARAFGKWIRGVLKLPVVYHDERCTSAAADDLMRAAGVTGRNATKSARDKLAAQILLQSYLDARRPPKEGVERTRMDPAADPGLAIPVTEPVRGRDRRKMRKQRRGKKGW